MCVRGSAASGEMGAWRCTGGVRGAALLEN